MLVNQRIPLTSGVSQAPDALRLPGELKEAENINIDPNRGITRRPPTQHIKNLESWQGRHDKASFFHINRDDSNRYIVVVADGDLKVFDKATGEEQPVSFPNGKAYLSHAQGNAWRATTIGDSTYLVNREKTVDWDRSLVSSPQGNFLFILVEEELFTNSYLAREGLEEGNRVLWNLRINTYQYNGSFDSKNVSRYLDDPEAARRTLAFDIYDTLRKQMAPHGWALVCNGASILIYHPESDARIGYRVGDERLTGGFRFIRGTVQSKEDLPDYAPPGLLIKVAGDPGTTEDDIWVISEEPEIGQFEDPTKNVVWRETLAPNTPYRLDRLTMPHVLKRQGVYRNNLVVKAGALGWQRPSVTVEYGDRAKLPPDSLNGEPLDNPQGDMVITTSGGTLKTALMGLPKGSGYNHARVVWNFSLSTFMPANARCVVHLRLYNDADALVASEDVTFLSQGGTSYSPHGRTTVVKSFSATHSDYYSEVFISFDLNGPTDIAQARLVLPGTDSEEPFCYLEGGTSTIVEFARRGQTVPAGTIMEGKVNGVHQTYVLESDMKGQDYATYVAINTTGPTTDPVFYEDVSRGTVGVRYSSGPFSVEVEDLHWMYHPRCCYNEAWDWTPNELAGMTVKNLSTGASGQIVSNTPKSILVDTLSGGSRQDFRQGDIIQIVTGDASTWVFMPVLWEDRLVGDTSDTSSPWPSFVGRKISDVAFHRSRLVFTSEDSVVFSAASDLHRFFRRTLTAVLEDDPIDVDIAASDRVLTVDSAVDWNGALYLNTHQGIQYVVTADGILSPQSVSIGHISSYGVSDRCKPYKLGQSLILPYTSGGHSQLRDYFESVYGRLSSNVLTERVSRYIKGNIVSLSGDPELGYLFVVTDNQGVAEMYVWQFRRTELELPLSAWHKWTFPSYQKVLNVDCYKGKLYITSKTRLPVQLWDSVTLEYIDLDYSGTALSYYDNTGYNFQGEYFSKFTLPPLYIYTEGGPKVLGRTQIRYLHMYYNDSGIFGVTIKPTLGESREYVKWANPKDGHRAIPVMMQNNKVDIEFTVMSPHTATISNLEFEAMYHNRSDPR